MVIRLTSWRKHLTHTFIIMNTYIKFFVLLFLCLFTNNGYAKITLPSIISNNMVLQQHTKANIWGKANPGEKISIVTSWNKKAQVCTADENGKWKMQIKTPKACKGQWMEISGENNIRIENILIGEVWLCTGQSNMEFPVARNPKVKWKTGIINEAEEMKDATFNDIRLFHVEHQLAPDGEKDDCKGEWMVCNPENLKDFSAIGFIFGRSLYKNLNTPIGLIQSTWGGTHAESWTDMDVMKDNPLYDEVFDEFAPKDNKRKKKAEKVPATLWNGMIAPILGYTVKGNIWYQGESNSVRYEKYGQVFTNLINSWRKEWGQPDMPFYFMQIAPHYKQPAGIREAQLNVWRNSKLKNIGMAVVTDACDSTDIHPRMKQQAGERLAAWALAKQYDKDVAFSGPAYKSMKVKDNQLILSFDYADGGLTTPDGQPVKGFYIAGNDEKFYPANATIQGKKVILTAPEVKHPVAARYGFGTFFRVNLYNNAGMPAVPFRTDSFKIK